jgi:hypothetical protein
VLCGVQREEAPQSGPLKPLLGVNPKATVRVAGYRGVEGVGHSHSSCLRREGGARGCGRG